MVEVLEEIKQKTSQRAFDDKPISDEMLESILEAGRLAPSCANTQAWDFVAIKDKEALEEVHETISGGNYWGKRAPVIIVIVTKEGGGCGAHDLPYWMMDVGLATQNILLQSFRLGLIAHPTAGWNEKEMKEVLGIPKEYRIGTVIFVGYKGDPSQLDERNQEREAAPRKRKPFEEIVHYDRW